MTEFRELSERYQLKKILRSTRFGSVLRATDTATGQTVAIKLIPIPSPERLQQGEAAFVRFAEALRSLRHPNLPLSGDSGFTADGSAFLAFEWLEGEPLTALGEIPVGRAVAWVLRALNALQAMAERGLAHHNLTTDNLFLAPSPEGGVIKLLGLGSPLFRPRGAGWEAGWPPETVRYQPPELAAADPGDPRVDIYALARIASELLGATIPPGDDPPVQLPLSVSFELENEAALRRVLEGALRRDPATRPSPRELREALQTAVTGMSAQPEVHPLDGTMADLAPPSILDAGALFSEPFGGEMPSLPPVPAQAPAPRKVEDPAALFAALLAADEPGRTAKPPVFTPPAEGGGPLQPSAQPSVQPTAPLPPLPPLPPVPSLSAPLQAAAPPSIPAPPAAGFAPPPPPSGPAATPMAPMAPPPPPFFSAPIAAPGAPPALGGPLPPPAGPPPAGAHLTPSELGGSEAAGDVLSAVDDDMLNALLAVPGSQAGAPQGQAATPSSMARVVPFSPRPVTQGRTATAPARKREAGQGLRWLRKPAVAGSLAGALLLAGVGGYFLLRREAPAPPAPAVQPNLPPPPSVPPTAELEEAKTLLAQGNDYEARRILEGISYAQQGLLPPQLCRELAAMEAVISAAGLESLPANLSNGLENGELRRLQQAVATADGEGKSLILPPEAQANLDRAREVVRSYGAAQGAAAKAAWPDVLQRLAELHKALPKLEDPEKLRDTAAAAVEEAADKLARDARYDEARTQLELVKASWPERAGLAQRITALATYKENEKKQTEVLAGMNAFERRRKPHEGLELLRSIEPTPHLEPQFKAARQRLEDLLSRLDQQVPQVALRDGYFLQYQKGTVVELSFRVTDDYQIKSVRMMARPKGGGLREVRLAKSTFGYTAEISPSFHRNTDVDFYVVATDLSGHEGYLGTPTAPMVLKRQQGFERIVR